MHNLKPLSNILVKPAGADCNMACDYCFYLDKSALYPGLKNHRMTIELLEILMRQVCEQGTEQISIAWQGGEPTLMGTDFFKKAVEFQSRYSNGKIIGNSLQTNGILIDKNWISFLKENRFLVGLSIDGPKHIHDYYRKYRNQTGSWEIVENSARMMLENRVEVNALSTVNAYSVDYPDEIYDYLKSLGFRYMQFIPVVELAIDCPGIASFSVKPGDYGEFLIRIFDRWINDFQDCEPTTSVRYFESLFFHYVGLQAPDCTLMKYCGSYVVIEYNGDVYPCDFFVDENWKLGNIRKDRLAALLNSVKQNNFGNQKADIPIKCQSCEWYKFCLNGCVKYRFTENNTERLNYFCEAVRAFLSHAHSGFQKLAKEWWQKNRF